MTDVRIPFHPHYFLYMSSHTYFNKSRIFSMDFRKIPKCQMLCESVHWKPSYSNRTGIKNLTVAIRNLQRRIKLAKIKKGSKSPVTLDIKQFATSVK
jgi:hypothetical protein